MDLENYMIPCLSKTLFGIDCLGCGFQRDFMLLLEGDFTTAFEMYPANYSVLIFQEIVGLHFIDKRNNYQKPIKVTAILTRLFMIVDHVYKTS